jgi:hypothetical protein
MNEVNYNIVEEKIDAIKLREILEKIEKMRASVMENDPDPDKIIITPLNLMNGE